MSVIQQFYNKVSTLNIETSTFIDGTYVDAKSGAIFDRAWHIKNIWISKSYGRILIHNIYDMYVITKYSESDIK